MSKFKVLFLCVLSACLAVCMAFGLAACSKSNPNFRTPEGGIADDGTFDPNNPGGVNDFYYPHGINPDDFVDEENSYIVNTLSLGGIPLKGVRVTLENAAGVTTSGVSSSSGKVIFPINSGSYSISYENLPAGYFEGDDIVKVIDDEHKNVTSRFSSFVIDQAIPVNYIYGTGDIMYDFTVTDGDDIDITLSEVLEDKELVILNFFYTQCGPCASEFPALNSAYSNYTSDVAVIALADPNQGDTVSLVRNYKNNMGLDFYMALDSIALTSRFGVTSYPTTVFIDRFGVICSRHTGSIPEERSWTALIERYLGDDYTQNVSGGETGGETGDGTVDYKAPPQSITMPDDAAINAAFTDGLDLTYSNETETDDSELSWPFIVGSDGTYLQPSNIGEGTDATFSTLHTSISLEEGDELSIQINYDTESRDALYIIINDTYNYDTVFSGASEGWQTVTLYTANRQTVIKLTIMYVKSADITIDGESVMLRHLKVHKFSESDITSATDVERSFFSFDNSGALKRKDNTEVVLNNTDGFYHVGSESGPLVMVDLQDITVWTDYRIPEYVLQNTEGGNVKKSVYFICYYKFSNAITSSEDNQQPILISLTDNADDNKRFTTAIIDGYYAQEALGGASIPVNKDMKDALAAFVNKVHNESEFGDTKAVTEDSWLEICSYFNHYPMNTEHPEGGICLSYENPAEGLTITFAKELKLDTLTDINTTGSTKRNQLGGQFYKFTATNAGVYSIESSDRDTTRQIDPSVFVWDKDYNYIAECDEPLGMERFKTDYYPNFKLLVYLDEGESVYAQLTTGGLNDNPGKYKVKVEYLAAEYWNLEIASTGEGLWTADIDEQGNIDMTHTYYLAVPVTVQGSETTAQYYNVVGSGNDKGSVMYISFTRPCMMNGPTFNTLQYYVEHNMFGENQATMLKYFNQSKEGKEEDDPLYGMVEANNELVRIISEFMTSQSGDDCGVDTRAWEAFAFYYHYYGMTAWKDKAN